MIKLISSARVTWQGWSARSVSRQIVKAMFTVGALSALVKLVTLYKELTIVWQFGIGDQLDILFTGLLIPGVLMTVLVASLQASFLPSLIKARESDGEAAAQRLFTNITTWNVVLLTLITLLMAAGAQFYLPFLARGFSATKFDETVRLFYLLVPWVVLNGMQALWGSVLYSVEKFALPAVTPVITPFLTILSVRIFAPSWGIEAVVAAMILGALLELVVIGYALHRRSLRLRLNWFQHDPYTGEVIRQFLPVAAGALIMSGTPIVDQFFVSALPPGSVSTLSYGIRLVQFTTGFVALALGTAVLPYFAKLAAQNSWAELRKVFIRNLVAVFALLTPVALLIIVFSIPISTLLLQRNAVTPEDVAKVASVQAFAAVQIPFYVASMLCVRLVTSMRHNTVLTFVSIGNFIVNIVADYWLLQVLGIAGIALSTALVYIFSFGSLCTFGLWRMRQQSRLTTRNAAT